ncbi:MAG TPA: sigma-70 family RNA polymerase sigma factor [Polyangia bacterium]|nr:sigma-70 family RNA polymerase sigma factor [Polyangia bacterium]
MAGSTADSPTSSKRLARARARALGQRIPYTMSVDERRLLDRLLERDEQAFNEIVRLYKDKVFSLIYRMLGSRPEAEDVAQEVFITVFKNIESFRGEAKFSTWLLRIAANHSKNRIKHLARRPTEGADPDDVSQLRALPDRPQPPVQARIETPDAMLEAAQTERLMQEAIANLPEDQRLLVVLRDVEEMSYQEIEEITGLPEGTIKSRLHRARMAIKEWVDRHTR